MEGYVAGRWVGEVYRAHRKADLHRFLLEAVEASGGRVLYVSSPDRAPIYLGVQLGSDERLGILVYPFRIKQVRTRNRPEDELRGQLRLGSEASWEREHPVARDVAGVDVTVIVGVDPEGGVLLGLDANLWDPLPMGISFYFKQLEFDAAKGTSWHVWEKESHGGSKRSEPRSGTHLETLVAFTPQRFLDYCRLERRSSSLRLDSPLRFAAAEAMAGLRPTGAPAEQHVLEDQFGLSSQQILDVIQGRNRLAVAVRGGIAEYHLEQLLREAPEVSVVHRLDVDAMHDFDVTLLDGRRVRVECKNASPRLDARGRHKVEVQKTRGSKGDPTSRFYDSDRFDVVAACLFSATGKWDFRFGATQGLTRHRDFPNKLAAIQPVTTDWAVDLAALTGP